MFFFSQSITRPIIPAPLTVFFHHMLNSADIENLELSQFPSLSCHHKYDNWMRAAATGRDDMVPLYSSFNQVKIISVNVNMLMGG